MSKKREEKKRTGGTQADDGGWRFGANLGLGEQGAREEAKQGRPMTGRRRPSGCWCFFSIRRKIWRVARTLYS